MARESSLKKKKGKRSDNGKRKSPNSKSVETLDDAEKSTDRDLWDDAMKGKFDPKSVGAREQQLMSMSKRQLVQIVLKFEEKYGRKHLALMLLGDSSDEEDNAEDLRAGYAEDDEDDSFERLAENSGRAFRRHGSHRRDHERPRGPESRHSGRRRQPLGGRFSDSQEELRVRNLDTGDVHGEESIDEQMADPRVVTASRTIRDLDSGRARLVPVNVNPSYHGGPAGSGRSIAGGSGSQSSSFRRLSIPQAQAPALPQQQYQPQRTASSGKAAGASSAVSSSGRKTSWWRRKLQALKN